MGFIAWVATIGRASLGENVSWAVDVAIAVAWLILTSAVLRSRGSEPLTRHQATTGKP